MVRAASVRDDLDAVEREVDVRRLGREELLARLEAERGVERLDDEDADRRGRRAGEGLEARRQPELLERPEPRAARVDEPRREVAHLAVVAVVREVDLRAEADDLAVEAHDAAVVRDVAVLHGHADVAQDPVGQVAVEQLVEALPRVLERVELEERVLAAVARDLELGPRAERAPRRLGLADRLLDPLEVAAEVHRPLVQVARRDAHEVAHRREEDRSSTPGEDPNSFE